MLILVCKAGQSRLVLLTDFEKKGAKNE